MNKLTISVPEGPHCNGCKFKDQEYPAAGCEIFYKQLHCKDEINWIKCPACLAACQQYRDEHDYEPSILKALEYDKEV